MSQDWQELTRITQGMSFVVERVRIPDKDLVVEGKFDLPQLAKLTMEDQIFVTAFLRSHGSIKEMEGMFGISYPTVKNRLNRIAGQLEFIDVNPPASNHDVLDQLDRGDISVDDALKKMRRRS
jgi:hypothetical protein